MPVKSISQVNGFPVIDTGWETIDCSTIKIEGVGGQADKNDRLKQGLQMLLDDAIPLADLPVDDLNKTTDPAKPNLFWDSSQTYLVSRSVECVDVTFDGTDYRVSLTRVR